MAPAREMVGYGRVEGAVGVGRQADLVSDAVELFLK